MDFPGVNHILEQGITFTFFAKDQIVNILYFMGQTISVTTIQLSCSVKVTVDNIQMNEYERVLIKFY